MACGVWGEGSRGAERNPPRHWRPARRRTLAHRQPADRRRDLGRSGRPRCCCTSVPGGHTRAGRGRLHERGGKRAAVDSQVAATGCPEDGDSAHMLSGWQPRRMAAPGARSLDSRLQLGVQAGGLTHAQLAQRHQGVGAVGKLAAGLVARGTALQGITSADSLCHVRAGQVPRTFSRPGLARTSSTPAGQPVDASTGGCRGPRAPPSLPAGGSLYLPALPPSRSPRGAQPGTLTSTASLAG